MPSLNQPGGLSFACSSRGGGGAREAKGRGFDGSTTISIFMCRSRYMTGRAAKVSRLFVEARPRKRSKLNAKASANHLVTVNRSPVSLRRIEYRTSPTVQFLPP